MKNPFLFSIIILLLGTYISSGQSKLTETVTVYNAFTTAVEQTSLTIPPGFTYSGTNPVYNSVAIYTNMGMVGDSIQVQVTKNSNQHDTTIYVTRKKTYRTIYEFRLNLIKYTPTNHANVTVVKVHYGTTGQSYTFKITQPNSYPASDEAIWTTVGNSTSRQTGVTYSGNIINPASGLNSPITANLSLPNPVIYLGIASEAESTSGSTAQINYGFYLEITYERDNEARTVTAQNDFHEYLGGEIYWGPNLLSSPQSQTLYEGATHTFGIKTPQTISLYGQTYNYIWHQGAVYPSKWEKRIGSTTWNLGSPTTINYTTNWQEVGTITHTAFMRRICNLTFNGLGGTVSIDGGAAQSFPQLRQIIELNPITAVASNFTDNGLNYTFNNQWKTSGGQTVSTSISTSQHETYTANYDVSLSGSYATLQTDFYVQPGTTFLIPSGATVDLNGYSIISAGGTITVQGTLSNLNAYLYDSGVIKGYFGTINSAVNYSTTYQSVVVPSGSYILTGNCTIPEASSLTLQSGANVSFNGYYIEKPYGATFNINNNSTVALKHGGKYYGLFTSIQDAIDNSASYQSIYLLSSSYSGSLSFSSKSSITLYGEGASLSGNISITNSSDITILNLTMNGCLTSNSSYNASLFDAIITGSTLANVYGGNITIGNTYAENIGASFGISAYGGYGYVYGSNISNGDLGIYITSDAFYDIYTQNVFCSNGYDVYVDNGDAFPANNYYSRLNPSPVYGTQLYGEAWLCSMGKVKASENSIVGLPQVHSELKDLNMEYSSIQRKIRKDKEENKYDLKNYLRDFDQLLAKYNNLIKEGSKKEVVKASLAKISNIYNDKNDKKGFYNFIAQSLADSKLNSFKPHLKRYLIWESVDNKQFENSLAIADEVLAFDISEDLQAEMLYEKGIIYKTYLNDFEKAEAMFSEIMDKYPQNLLSRFAALELGIEPIKMELNNKQENSEESNDSETIVNGLSDAFPNPFNPKTIINYSLAEKGYVSIKVFDILGSELAELVNEVKDAGKHTVQFNASNLPSGVYIYSIQVNNPAGGGFKATRKMILAK